jgi:hypothetical protein
LLVLDFLYVLYNLNSILLYVDCSVAYMVLYKWHRLTAITLGNIATLENIVFFIALALIQAFGLAILQTILEGYGWSFYNGQTAIGLFLVLVILAYLSEKRVQ